MPNDEIVNPKSGRNETGAGQNQVAWWHLHRRLYDWVVHWAYTSHAQVALFLLAFAESSFFPVPPDVLLAAMSLGNPRKWLRFALLCSIASVIGGCFGYMIGMFLWAGVGNFFHNHVPGFSRDVFVLTSGQEVHGLVDRNCIDAKMTFDPWPKFEKTLVYPVVLSIPDGQNQSFGEQSIKEVKINPFTSVGALYERYDWEIVAIAGFTPIPYKVITVTAGVFKINFIVFCIASVLSRSARFFVVAGLLGWKGEKIRPVIEKYFNWFALAFVVLLIGGFLAIKWLS
jgi:membrane protein YqaA with SNARE-associated domain